MTERETVRTAGLCGVAALLFAVAWLVCSTLDSVRFQPGADEGFYLAYASRVAMEGPAAFPRLFTAYLHSPEISGLFPNPLRLVTISLGALALKLGGGAYFTNLALLSLVSFLAVLLLMFAAAARAFGWRTAAWTVLLLSAAPLHLALARRALNDTLTSFFLLGGLWLFLRAIWSETKGPPLRWAAVMLWFAAALLVKESGFMLVPIALFFLVWRGIRLGRPPGLWPVLAVSLLPMALAGGAMALAAGGAGRVFETFRLFSGTAAVNEYALKYQGGPWFRFIIDMILLSPWPVFCWLVWTGVLIGGRTWDERVWFWALVPALSLAMLCLVPHARNPRLSLFLEAPMRLCMVLLLQWITQDRKGNLFSTALIAAVVGCMMWGDLQTFWGIFVLGEVYDPVGTSLLAARGFIP